MKVKTLKNLLYRLDDEDEVLVLNENAPIKAAVPVKKTFVITDEDEKPKGVLVYESKNGKEGSK